MTEREGREALVHLRVPASLKARWVKASQRRGAKLTEHLLDMIQRGEMMKVYPITDTMAGQYHGAGYALAAVTGGHVVALRYLQELDDTLADDLAEGGQQARQAVMRWIGSDAAAPAVRELQALGEVSAGMCSAWEFVEL